MQNCDAARSSRQRREESSPVRGEFVSVFGPNVRRANLIKRFIGLVDNQADNRVEMTRGWIIITSHYLYILFSIFRCIMKSFKAQAPISRSSEIVFFMK